MDGVLSSLRALDSDGRVGALCEDNDALLLGVLLGQLGDLLSDLLDVLGGDVVGFGECGRLGLVSDQDIDVRQDRVELVLEELRDEGSREVENKGLHDLACFFLQRAVPYHLVVLGSVLGQGQNGRHGDSQVVTTDVEDLGTLDVLPHFRLLQMVDIVEVGGSKVGAKGAVVAGDDNTTAASGCLLVIAVHCLDTSLLVDVLKRLAVLVLANAANVHGGVLGEDVLGPAGGVLGSSTSNEHGIVVLDQVFEETKVLLLGENSIVGLEAVLLEELLVSGCIVSADRSFHVAMLQKARPLPGQEQPLQENVPDTLNVKERVLQSKKFKVSLGHCEFVSSLSSLSSLSVLMVFGRKKVRKRGAARLMKHGGAFSATSGPEADQQRIAD